MARRYYCGKPERRLRTLASPLNGIDWLEVVDSGLPQTSTLRQKTLLVHFLKTAPNIAANRIAIEGGVRVSTVPVAWVRRANAIPAGFVASPPEPNYAALPDAPNVLVVRVQESGDFSTYTLRIAGASAAAPDNLDPQLASIGFSFKVECPSEFDCQPRHDCPPETFVDPGLDYLAKDYATLRRLMLDRMSVVMPQWRERNAADIGIALVELLAYSGDRISYLQDAVATEAYLDTARRRTSVRRHARLLDYPMHDGCNARTWVCLQVAPGADGLTVMPFGQALNPGEVELQFLTAPGPGGDVVFEAMHPLTLRVARNQLLFHTWSDSECCLPKGATRATLVDSPGLVLAPGDVLVFEEVGDPRFGKKSSANPAHRQAVRLTRAAKGTDPVAGVPIVEIEWHAGDALLFPLCVSGTIETKTGAGTTYSYRPDLAVARANVVLVDHGESSVAQKALANPSDTRQPRIELRQANLTYSTAFDRDAAALAPAAAVLARDPRTALPAIVLQGEQLAWRPRRDLLGSDRFAAEFVLETESDGSAAIRFGDDQLGRRPSKDSVFTATMRLGNGAAGNIGRNAIVAVRPAIDLAAADGVTNPMPAAGGIEPEPIARVKLDAPQAFRTQRRAVTADDYARAAEQVDEVTRAAARFRWTGSWYTVFVTVDRAHDRPVDASFERKVRGALESVRLAGYDLEIEAPVMAPLEIVLVVCVKPGYFRANVKRDLLEVLSSRDLPGGRQGFFHPDRFTFGTTLFLSRIYEAALAVAGVASVEARTFKRRGRDQGNEIADGYLRAAPLEILRLANDPSFPEHGRLELEMRGGL